jgi:hypothetical protein
LILEFFGNIIHQLLRKKMKREIINYVEREMDKDLNEKEIKWIENMILITKEYEIKEEEYKIILKKLIETEKIFTKIIEMKEIEEENKYKTSESNESILIGKIKYTNNHYEIISKGNKKYIEIIKEGLNNINNNVYWIKKWSFIPVLLNKQSTMNEKTKSYFEVSYTDFEVIQEKKRNNEVRNMIYGKLISISNIFYKMEEKYCMLEMMNYSSKKYVLLKEEFLYLRNIKLFENYIITNLIKCYFKKKIIYFFTNFSNIYFYNKIIELDFSNFYKNNFIYIYEGIFYYKYNN